MLYGLEDLEQYIIEYSEQESPLLQELSRETHLKMLHPRMLSGFMQGKILSSFSKMMQPKRILELGTYTGYSAICLSEGLAPDGLLTTVEVDEEIIWLAKKYITKAQLDDKVNIIVGDALEVIPTLEDTFDLVFIDANKRDYSAYFDLIFPKVRKGGLIIADNVLWSGKVIEPNLRNNDYFTKGIKAFNEKINKDNRVSNYILPIRDGMMMIHKL